MVPVYTCPLGKCFSVKKKKKYVLHRIYYNHTLTETDLPLTGPYYHQTTHNQHKDNSKITQLLVNNTKILAIDGGEIKCIFICFPLISRKEEML